jgi:uncharacterized protein YndB with AHSA1/START domain
MARNTIHADVPPESVWEVLADPRLYGNWVVGASTTRAVDGRWPEAGATLHHTQLLVLNDTTTVLESEPARRLVLEARARPILITRVEVNLEPDGDGTRIVLDEKAVGGFAAAAPESATDPVIHLRNTDAVRRLKRLAEIGHGLGRD